MHSRAYWGGAFAAALFLLVQLGALALVTPFEAAGYQTVEDPSDPVNSLLYIGAILVATAVMLAAFRFGLDQFIRGLIILTTAMLSWYVFSVLVPPVLVVETALGGVNLLAVTASILLAVALFVHPEWYVIDLTGVVMGAAAGGLFGISFGLLPAIVLLVVLAVYDAISVYGTRHMLSLAEGVMDLHIPVILVVPLTLSYSLLREPDGPSSEAAADSSAETTDGGEGGDGTENSDESSSPEPGEREAFFIGLGDAVMPTVMVASAAFFSPAASLGIAFLPALNLPALLAMVGTFLGLAVLLWAVMKGRPHAGLPLLNGGAIGGYLLGSAIAGVSLVNALGLGSYL
ncbi:MAG: presenilin family intramembrane aspartyl protease PSH [Halobacteriota archaeon]